MKVISKLVIDNNNNSSWRKQHNYNSSWRKKHNYVYYKRRLQILTEHELEAGDINYHGCYNIRESNITLFMTRIKLFFILYINGLYKIYDIKHSKKNLKKQHFFMILLVCNNFVVIILKLYES